MRALVKYVPIEVFQLIVDGLLDPSPPTSAAAAAAAAAACIPSSSSPSAAPSPPPPPSCCGRHYTTAAAAALMMMERRSVTVLFANAENYSSICELITVTEVMKLTAEYFEILCGVIVSKEGVVDKVFVCVRVCACVYNTVGAFGIVHRHRQKKNYIY